MDSCFRFDALRNLAQLEEINFSETKVQNLDPLKNLIKMKRLDCSYNDVVDLSPLSSLRLMEYLDIGNTKVVNIDCVSGMDCLIDFDISNTSITNLNPLLHAKKLKKLIIQNTPTGSEAGPREKSYKRPTHQIGKAFETLDFLRNAQQLECLDIEACDVKDVSALRILKNLKGLNIHNRFNLSRHSILKRIYVDKTDIFDLSDFSELHNLEKLHFSSTHVSNLNYIESFPNLSWLGADHTNIEDLSPLSCLIKLKHLNLSATMINDIKPLGQLPHLEWLNICNTNIHDFCPLSKLQKLKYLCVGEPAPFRDAFMSIEEASDNGLNWQRLYERSLKKFLIRENGNTL